MAAALGTSEQDLMLEEKQRFVAAEGGLVQRDVVTYPDEITEIFEGDNEALKRAVKDYAASLLLQVRRIAAEQEALLSARGAASEPKQPSQDIGKSIDDMLDEAM